MYLKVFTLLVVAVYTAYPFIFGTPVWDAGDQVVTDVEALAFTVANQSWFPYPYYGHIFLFLIPPQVYYYLTPALAMVPAIFMRLDRWFWVWLIVLFGAFGYLRHMLMGSFLPVINYMIFIPLNLMLLNKGRYRWLVVAMLASVMFHSSSGVIIQAGTLLCMATRLKLKDWIRVAPLAVPALAIFVLNHEIAPSTAAHMLAGNTFSDGPLGSSYSNYLSVIRHNGILGRTDWFNYLPVNWFFYYLGLPLLPALAVIGVTWARGFRDYTLQLVRFTALPLAIIVAWATMADSRASIFAWQDRASNALSIIIFMAAGLALQRCVRPKDA